MSRSPDSVWYDLGRALGYVASAWTGKTTRGAGARSGSHGGVHRGVGPSADDGPELGDAAVAAIASTVASMAWSAFRSWRGKDGITAGALLRGAAAGAGAAGVVFALSRLSRNGRISVGLDEAGAADLIDDLIDHLLAGAGRGLVYAAVLDPLLPGPPIVRGALAGTADYLALPLGGLFTRLQAFSPIRRVPVISALLDAGETEDDSYLTFLGYGLVLGLLYGDPPAAST
jgi:hypothetical protein